MTYTLLTLSEIYLAKFNKKVISFKYEMFTTLMIDFKMLVGITDIDF